MTIFKAYDIRGIYNRDWNKETAYKIGLCLPELVTKDSFLIGRDARLSSDEIFHALSEGITDAGADVFDAGLATTPMIYFGTSFYQFKGSVQITASHNSKEYNGLKISGECSIPVGYDDGLDRLEQMISEAVQNRKISAKGKIVEKDIKPDYIDFLLRYREDYADLKIGIDCSNGMVSILIKDILPEKSNVSYLFDKLDGTFPNHEPNPLVEENVEDLKKLVSENKLDIGIIFDGDADRVMFVDENSRFVSPDLMIALMGEYFLKTEKGIVLHDIRTSKSVSEYIEKLRGTPYMWKVGHSHAKRKLRELDGVYGGELAGHYYFRDFFYCDSGILAALIVLDVVSKMKKDGISFSSFIDSVTKYYFSGEINFKIEKKLEAMENIKNFYFKHETVRQFYDFDGYRMEFDSWWLNIRPSNTEPYLRLVCEAKSQDLLNEKVHQIRNLIARTEE